MRAPLTRVSLALMPALAAGALIAQTPAINQRVPAQPPLALELPIARDGAFQVIERLLMLAGVGYGLEQAPPPVPGAVPEDLGSPPQQMVSMNGLRIRDALNRMVALDPRYGWEERDGRILVRAVGTSADFLHRTVPRLELHGASVADTLQALARAVVPGRPPGGIFTSGLTMTGPSAPPRTAPVAGAPDANQPHQPSSAPARRITVAIAGRPVLDTLEAIARAHGALSWQVRYSSAAATPDDVMVTFKTGGTSVGMLPAKLVNASRRDPTTRVNIPNTGELESILRFYASRTHALIGFERIPSPHRQVRPTQSPGIELTGVAPPDAVAQMTALDSRYEWADDGGIFTIRPRRDLVEQSPLDRPVGDFSAADDTLDTILDRIVSLLGATKSNGGEGRSGPPESPERRAQEAARQRRLSFTTRDTTVREILNAMCRAEGTLGWLVDPQPVERGGVFVGLHLQSYTGWSTGRTFTLPRWP